MASTGAKIAAVETAVAVPVSTEETMGFAIPPVVAVDPKRVVAEAPLIIVAVPPPAIIANAQVAVGVKSVTVESMTIVPAKVANGIAMLSNKLSSQGIKYAKISINVAIAKVNNAGILPTHSQFSFRFKIPK